MIEVVCEKNIAMAKGKYMLVKTHESIDIMISIMTYICSQREQFITI